jgi:hypothetical protein
MTNREMLNAVFVCLAVFGVAVVCAVLGGKWTIQ